MTTEEKQGLLECLQKQVEQLDNLIEDYEHCLAMRVNERKMFKKLIKILEGK
jgi:hypothetical protein